MGLMRYRKGLYGRTPGAPMNIYRCPMCEVEVFCRMVSDFRCPQCGFAGGNQLSLFRSGCENDGSIRHIGTFDSTKNAEQAYLYHLQQEKKR